MSVENTEFGILGPVTMEQRAKIDALIRRPRPTVQPTAEELRTGFAALMSRMIVPAGIRTEPATLGDRLALRVEPVDAARPGTILFFHGGAFVAGSPETGLSLAASLVVKTGFTALSLDYRLAPEHPFPAGIEDAVDAYRELLDRGVDPATIAFAGDSAGGGISVTSCLMARDAGLPLPAAIVTFSGGFDATHTGESMVTKVGIDPLFTPEALANTGAMYRGTSNPAQPLLSPATLADLSGFPPLLLQVGTNEILLDDSTRLAARARAAGVDVILDVTADVPHVFQIFAGVLDEADQALDRAAFFLSQHVRAEG